MEQDYVSRTSSWQKSWILRFFQPSLTYIMLRPVLDHLKWRFDSWNGQKLWKYGIRGIGSEPLNSSHHVRALRMVGDDQYLQVNILWNWSPRIRALLVSWSDRAPSMWYSYIWKRFSNPNDSKRKMSHPQKNENRGFSGRKSSPYKDWIAFREALRASEERLIESVRI